MSVSKLLSRIVAPDLLSQEQELESKLHDHTYGTFVWYTACTFCRLKGTPKLLVSNYSLHSGIPKVSLRIRLLSFLWSLVL